MGLISKIEDKLSGSKSDSSKLEKPGYGSSTGTSGLTSGATSGATSKLQNPISSSSGGTSGTYGSNTGTTSGQSYPSRGDGYESRAQDTSGYTSSGRPQDTSGYTSSGRPQDTSGYTSGATDRMPGNYPTDESDRLPSSTTNTTTTTTSSGARQPYDPYSSKGQETAARAGTTGYGSSQSQDYDRIGTNDPSLLRSKDGGIMNQSTDQRYGTQQPSSASPTTGQSHYGRDAVMVGGAGAATGAAGVGAYEMGKDHSSSQPLTSSMGQQQYQDPSQMNQPQYISRDTPMAGGQQYQDASYMNQPQQTSRDATMAGGAMQPGAMGSQQPGAMGGQPQSPTSSESAGLTQARKMGGAYEAGYKDAMEHMKQEMASKGGSAF